jgi:hypothetical protein
MRPHGLLRREKWPNKTEHIFPHGYEDTTRALLRWLQVGPDNSARQDLHYAIDAVLSAGSSYCVTYLVSSPIFLESIILHPREVIDYYKGPTMILEEVVAQTSRALRWSSRFLDEFLLSHCDETQAKHIIKLHGEKMLEVSLEILHTSYEAAKSEKDNSGPVSVPWKFDDTNIMRHCITVGSMIMSFMPSIGTTAIAEVSRPLLDKWGVPRGDKISMQWYQFGYSTRTLSYREHCAAPGCRKTFADCGRMSYCDYCRRVRYCSRSCQKRAWKHPAAPHRSVCDAIHKVYLALKLSKKYAGSSLAQAGKYPKEFMHLLKDARTISDHIQAQTLWEMSLASCKPQ